MYRDNAIGELTSTCTCHWLTSLALVACIRMAWVPGVSLCHATDLYRSSGVRLRILPHTDQILVVMLGPGEDMHCGETEISQKLDNVVVM